MRGPLNLIALLFAVGALCANAAPGDVDTNFNSSINDQVFATAVQPDGKVIIGGLFTTVGGVARNRIARLNADGTLDQNFNPNASGTVYSMALQADGKILLGGNFNVLAGVSRRFVARLYSDGTLDIGFNPNANGLVYSMALRPDGMIVLGGNFTNVGGVTRNYSARLNADGSLDTGFNPDMNFAVYGTTIQADGKVIIGGGFTTVGGVARRGVVRLNEDGSLDSSFNANANGYAHSILVQPDGNIVIGGNFTSIGGVGRNHVARIQAAGGGLDTTFINPNVNGSVNGMAMQVDGKIVVAGAFTTVGGVLRNRIARLNADGSLDTGFNPNSNSNVSGVAIQPDGKLLMGGVFTSVGESTRNYLARLDNGTASQSLTAPTADSVQWLRSGSAPQTTGVSFELSTDDGSSWTPLGSGTRTVGGWELIGLTLPVSGYVRARGDAVGGYFSSSVGLLETVGAFPPGPEIVVEQPLSMNVTDGGTRSLGVANVGQSSATTFTIRNTGNADLTGLSVTIDGPDAEMFSVTTAPAFVISGPVGSTTFTVQFAPTSLGAKSAVLHVACNDNDEGIFDITVTGSDPIPEIAVQQPLGTNVSDEGTKSAAAAVGDTASLTFTILSLGTDSLTGLTIIKDGAQASEFVLTSLPTAPVAPSGSTTFNVAFTPTAGGTRTAAIHISSNDADESPYDITLAGQALTFTQDTDGDGMSDAAELRLATLGFNWQITQASLVSTYFANANASGLYTPSQVQALNVGVPLLQRNPFTGEFTVTLGLEKSTDLLHFDPFPMTTPETTLNGQGQVEFKFTVPDTAAFFRLQAQ